MCEKWRSDFRFFFLVRKCCEWISRAKKKNPKIEENLLHWPLPEMLWRNICGAVHCAQMTPNLLQLKQHCKAAWQNSFTMVWENDQDMIPRSRHRTFLHMVDFGSIVYFLNFRTLWIFLFHVINYRSPEWPSFADNWLTDLGLLTSLLHSGVFSTSSIHLAVRISFWACKWAILIYWQTLFQLLVKHAVSQLIKILVSEGFTRASENLDATSWTGEGVVKINLSWPQI